MKRKVNIDVCGDKSLYVIVRDYKGIIASKTFPSGTSIHEASGWASIVERNETCFGSKKVQHE